MRKNKWQVYPIFLLGFILFNSACAQNPLLTGQAYLNEEKLAAQTTVLLNNAGSLVPLQNLDKLKIASIHFSNQYASDFDSLLNKYAKVTTVNGSNYSGKKNLDDLSSELKWYNTLIVQLNQADLNDPLIFRFISANQKIKNVIVALFGNSNALLKLNDVTAPVIWSERAS
ncbi:MAG: beta-N-acetylglucosaminidase, partial [Bacteroidota bacterium]|nr:beta-N-acetylglucosaminidase [Bacteroidota bacterium]